MLETPFYIACLKLKGRRCLVVGGGEVGLEKVEGLLALRRRRDRWSPPRSSRELADYAAEGSITWEQRTFLDGDLDGAFLAIAATNDTEVNIAVSEGAERRAMLVNVVDVPPLCNFILPAIVRSGPLAIAISTAGASPALAKRMKREIAESFGEPYARLAVILNDARGWAKATLPTYQDRKEFFEGIVNGDPDPVELIKQGREDEVRRLIEAAQGALRRGARRVRLAERCALPPDQQYSLRALQPFPLRCSRWSAVGRRAGPPTCPRLEHRLRRAIGGRSRSISAKYSSTESA